MMLKRASGVAARAVGPRGFMWASMAAVAAGVSAALWASFATGPLVVWLSLNAAALLISAAVSGGMCEGGHFDWRNVDRTPAMWAVMAEWRRGSPPSWWRLIVWTLLIPAELAATFVVRPVVLAVGALLRPMPGEWRVDAPARRNPEPKAGTSRVMV
jgi:hypothetical protein